MECMTCKKSFRHRASLDRHEKLQTCHFNSTRLICDDCPRTFSRKDALKRHRETMHRGGRQLLFCGLCTKTFAERDDLLKHKMENHQLRSSFYMLQSAHKKACQLYRLNLPDNIVMMNDAIKFFRSKLSLLTKYLLAEKKFMKISLCLALRFAKPDFRPQDEQMVGLEGSEVITINLRSSTSLLMLADNVDKVLHRLTREVDIACEDFVQNGSGWVLVDCLYLDLQVAQCAPLTGSCERHVVVYTNRKFEVNSMSEIGEDIKQERCFLLAVASHFTGGDLTKSRLDNFITTQLKVNISLPVNVKDIQQFEEDNSHLDLAINVLFQDSSAVFPLYASKSIKAKNIVNLLMYYTNDGDDDVSSLHYARVDDLGKLLAERKQSENGNWHTSNKYVCFNCFCCFSRESTLERHVQWCHTHDGQAVILPQEGEVVKFEKKHKEFKLGYVFFFDFETLQTTPERTCPCEESNLDKCSHKSKIVSEHKAFAYSLLMINRDSEVVEDIVYLGNDAMEHFLKTIVRLEKTYIKKLKEVTPMKISPEEERAFKSAKNCHICAQPLEYDRVRDHDHINGMYIGPAHNKCNLARSECLKIVGFAHNFSGYDSHIMMRAIAERDEGMKEIKAIPLNTEKFKMVKIGRCVLMDSMAFLGASLDNLVKTLKASNHSFPILKQWMRDTNQRELILRKGVYPYEFATSLNVLRDTCTLPKKEEFFSLLSGEHITDGDYQHATNVWNSFQCRDMCDYTELYVRADTYQLAEAMLELRESVISEFNIDLCHYLSLPMMAKDIMLKFTNVEMELMSDVEMIHMIRSNIRGGLSYVNTRHFHCAEESKKREENVSAAYVDANNLYGAAMRFAMPLCDFQWMTDSELEIFTMDQITEYGSEGYIFEVTLDYPEHLHLEHSSYPLAPHQMDITEEHLSDYARAALHDLQQKTKYTAKKLTSTFLRRENYVCHGLNLKLYLELGMELVTIHRGVKFTQECFLRPYIDMCTKKRAESVTKTKKNMMKLLSNSLYGKMIESGANRMDCKIVRNQKTALAYNTNPRLKANLIFSENLVVTFLRKSRVKLNQSWAVGFAILEISKYIMQSLMYKAVKPCFGGRVSTLLSDTDSWILVLPSSSSENAMTKLKDFMDFSNYPPDHHLFDSSVQNRTGFLKNELPGDEILEVVGIRSKTYAIKSEKTLNRCCKGVKKATKNRIPFSAFVACVKDMGIHHVEQYTIQSKKHINRLMRCQKIAFSSFDDKRHLLCGIHSVPYGSKIIEFSKKIKQCYFCKYPKMLY